VNQKLTKGLLTAGILLLHALTAWRTGVDTYSVTGDLLNVVLIDATFVIAALAAAYLGGSIESLFIRPVAAVLAWVLYVQMVVIGFEAHADQPEVALAVRTAGFGLLVLDTWVYIVAAGRKLRASGSQAKDWRASLRGGVASIAYVLASILLAPVVAIIMLVRACGDYLRDGRPQATGVRVKVSDSMVAAINSEADRIMGRAAAYQPPNRANNRSPHTPPPAEYHQNDEGEWSFNCPICGPEHDGARLKQYPDEASARRGYAAHSAIHNRQSSSSPAPVMMGSDQ
jgi:hypothetical protein